MAVGQDTAQVRTDSLAVPEQAPESLPPKTVLPVEAPRTPPGPLPPGSRYTFTRDSILWSSAHTLADLLGAIPGVYVARGGFVGQPEYVQYGGRGGQAVELYWDGLPWEPLGSDSLFNDPGRIPLTYLRRIDVEVLPAALRINLVSERHESRAVRSLVRVVSGAFKTAAYTGLFQKRWSSGLGLNLAADFLGTDGASGPGRGDQTFDVWAKISWMPSGKVGATYQIRRQDHERDPVSSIAGALGVPERMGARTDFLFTLFGGTRADGLGFQAQGGLAASSWSADSASAIPDQSLRNAYVDLRYVRPSWTAALRSRVGDARTTLEVEGRLGWVPLPGIVLAADARWRQHVGDRVSRGVHLSGGLYRGPVSLVGDIHFQHAVQAPALLADTAIRSVDRSLRAELRTRLLAGHIGVVRRDAYEPLPYPDLSVIAGLAPSPAATYLLTDIQLRPTSAITLSGWYSNAISGTPADLQPPHHGRVAATLRSKFWRTFRSGAFDLKLQLAMESWSTGTAGLDAQGGPITLSGATFYEVHIEFQIASFTGFWNMRNFRLTEAQYVPDLQYPRNAQTFGVTWVFGN